MLLDFLLDLDKEQEGNEFDSDYSDDAESEEDDEHEFSFEDAMAELESVEPAEQNVTASVPAKSMSEEQKEILRIMAAMDEELMTPGGVSVMGESFARREADK